MKRFCTQCGNEICDNEFCSNCGTWAEIRGFNQSMKNNRVTSFFGNGTGRYYAFLLIFPILQLIFFLFDWVEFYKFDKLYASESLWTLNSNIEYIMHGLGAYYNFDSCEEVLERVATMSYLGLIASSIFTLIACKYALSKKSAAIAFANAAMILTILISFRVLSLSEEVTSIVGSNFRINSIPYVTIIFGLIGMIAINRLSGLMRRSETNKKLVEGYGAI